MTKTEIISQLQLISDNELFVYFINQLHTIFEILSQSELTEILEERGTSVLSGLRTSLFNELLIAKLLSDDNYELRLRKYPNSIINDIYLIGQCLIEKRIVEGFMDIVKFIPPEMQTDNTPNSSEESPKTGFYINEQQWNDILQELTNLRKTVKKLGDRVASLEKDNEALHERLQDCGWNLSTFAAGNTSKFDSDNCSRYSNDTGDEDVQINDWRSLINSKTNEGSSSNGESSSVGTTQRKIYTKTVPLPPLFFENMDTSVTSTKPPSSQDSNNDGYTMNETTEISQAVLGPKTEPDTQAIKTTTAAASPFVLIAPASSRNATNTSTGKAGLIYLNNNKNCPMNSALLLEKQNSYMLHRNPLKLARELLDLLIIPADIKNSLTNLDNEKKTHFSSDVIQSIITHIVDNFPNALNEAGFGSTIEFARRFWRNLAHSDYMRRYRRRKSIQ